MKGLLIDGTPVYDYDGICYGYRPVEVPGHHHLSDHYYPTWIIMCDEGLTEVYPCDQPIKDDILSEISNPDYDALLICAHGASSVFNVRHGTLEEPVTRDKWEYIHWDDIKEAMNHRDPYKFVMLCMCYAMMNTTEETISYQLTDGYSDGTTVIGFDNKGDHQMYRNPEILFNPIINGSSVWLSYWNVIEKYGVVSSKLKFVGDYSYTPHHQNNLDVTGIYFESNNIQQMSHPIINIDTFNKTGFIGPKVILITRNGEEYYPAEISYLETDEPNKTTIISLPQETEPGEIEFCAYGSEDNNVYCKNIIVYQPLPHNSLLPIALAFIAIVAFIYITKR